MEPVSTQNNQYIDIVSGLLREKHEVIGIESSFKQWTRLKRRDTVAILNWFESKVSHSRFPLLGFLKSVLILFYLKLTCSKVIWVKHNHKPHDAKGSLAKKLTEYIEQLMQGVCNPILTHDKVAGLESVVVPHPLYLRHPISNPEVQRDIEFLIFGQVKRYKNLSALFNIWPASVPLKLVGKSESDSLRQELLGIIKERGLAVSWDDRFIPDEELNALLQRTQFAILPHSEDSMIVSGAFYHSITFGCNVLMADNAFARNMQARHSFCHILETGQEIVGQLNKALHSTQSSTDIITQAFDFYSDKRVSDGFGQAIMDEQSSIALRTLQ
jgi:hypothetical protein